MKKFILVILILPILFIMAGCQCKHEWSDATCTSPQKCLKCNISNGQPLPHTLTSATCKEPQKCTVCGATEGDVLPHNWGTANCIVLKTCLDCGTTEGELLPHSWEAPTCTRPKTCTVCGVTDGDKLSHTPVAEWVTKDVSYIYAEEERVQTCSGCGETVKTEILDIEKLHDGTFFIITPEEFATRFGNMLDSYTGNSYKTKSATTEDSYGFGVVENGSAVCVFIFSKNGDMITDAQKNDNGAFNKLLGKCNNDSNALARITLALIQTVDPTITFDDAKIYATELMEDESVTINGVTYILMSYGGEYVIGFTID